MTRDFLSEILAKKRVRLERAMTERQLREVIEAASIVRATARKFALSAALKSRRGPALIAEFKRASPSRGPINPEANPGEIAFRYERGGAAAISVLTEEDYFSGSLNDLREMKSHVSIPVLRKDFIFEPYQVYESAAAGADALLLIAAALSDQQLVKLRRLAEDELQMDALVEVHTVEEMRRAVESKATLIGVNNRNLATFEVSLEISAQLAEHAPPGTILISESGLRTAADIGRLHELGYQGFLVGETLMTAKDPARELRRLSASKATLEETTRTFSKS